MVSEHQSWKEPFVFNLVARFSWLRYFTFCILFPEIQPVILIHYAHKWPLMLKVPSSIPVQTDICDKVFLNALGWIHTGVNFKDVLHIPKFHGQFLRLFLKSNHCKTWWAICCGSMKNKTSHQWTSFKCRGIGHGSSHLIISLASGEF
jgi:hypothetical protein